MFGNESKVTNQALNKPFDRRAGNWKQRLLPPPVGIMRRQSRPDIVAFIVCSCMGRNSFMPNTDSSFDCKSFDQEKSKT